MLSSGPRLRTRGWQCRGDPSPCATDRAASGGALRYPAEAAAAGAGALVFNETLGLLCDGDVCDHRVPGTETISIFDRDHLTTEGSLYLAPFLACFLERAGLL